VPLGYLQELAGYRADGYDWRKHEARLNQHPSSPPPSTAHGGEAADASTW